MAYGLPAMGRCRAPGPEEIIQERKNGFLVKNAEEAANILSKLIVDRSILQVMHKNCRRFVGENYSYDASYQSFKKICDGIVLNASF